MGIVIADDEQEADQARALLDAPDLASALESEPFRRFLDQVPIAIAVARIEGEGGGDERIVYVNPRFEDLTGQPASEVEGQSWDVLRGVRREDDAPRPLGEIIRESSELAEVFSVARPDGEAALVQVYCNVIEDDEGKPTFRLAAMVAAQTTTDDEREAFEQRIRDKDTLLKEIQHRVKNNLQMITALIRLEARNAPKGSTTHFDRLAGRIESLQLLYQSLSHDETSQEIDLGVYLSQIASAVMRSHAVEGIRLDLKIDAYPVSLNVAMPAGLVVNELLTNALKHAFVGREGGTITLHSLADSQGCKVVVADDGVGLPEGVSWPKRGKLGALIVQSLRDNAKAGLEVESQPGEGMRVTIRFTRAAAAPEG